MLATRKPRQCLTKSMASCATCWANSRVGQTISAPGVGALKLRALVGSLRLGRLGASSPLAADYDYTLAGKEKELQAAKERLAKTKEALNPQDMMKFQQGIAEVSNRFTEMVANNIGPLQAAFMKLAGFIAPYLGYQFGFSAFKKLFFRIINN